MAWVLIEKGVEGDRGGIPKREGGTKEGGGIPKREGKPKEAMGGRSEGVERRMDNGEAKKSSEGQTAVAKAGARLGAPTLLMVMAKNEKSAP